MLTLTLLLGARACAGSGVRGVFWGRCRSAARQGKARCFIHSSYRPIQCPGKPSSRQRPDIGRTTRRRADPRTRQAQAFAGAPGTRGTGACSSCGPFGCGEPTSFTCTMHGRVLGLELASCDRSVYSGGAGIMAPPDMKSEGRGKRRVVMREVGGRWPASSNDSAQDLEARGAASDGRCVDVLRRR
ncbi:hypothetical protein C8Q76DRAFT_128917 [Earliella scabrosa]|nr:hypothetical protein C8Q76DRAFT_128917 [Earliella scabrosa]